MIVLDTHAWLWLVLEDKNLKKPHVLRKIRQRAEQNELYLSDFSIWEAALLISRGRLQVNDNPGIWLRRASAQPGMNILPITPEVALQSCSFGAHFPSDPADRIIAATAKSLHATLVTRDEKLLKGCKAETIEVLTP